MKKTLFLSFISLILSVAFCGDPLWMRYPAISPDGNQIAFSYGGDLFIVSAAGGTAVQITSNPAHDYLPVWSPNGSRIAFASDRHGNYDVFTIPSTGGKPDRLTYHSANDLPSGWTPEGDAILFSSNRMDNVESTLFPSRRMTELYQVSVDGSRPIQILTTPAEHAVYNPKGDYIYYIDRKGYENEWRKHHRSAEARDIWKYEIKSGEHTQLTEFPGEDRDPVTNDGKWIYYLSETSGSFNVWKMKNTGKNLEQITYLDTHPVRFLTISEKGMLCFGFRGEIYTVASGGKNPKKVNISLFADNQSNSVQYKTFSDGATEMAVSPDSKEIAFIIRGEVFVTSAEYDNTRRITNTPEQERNISFSHDGRKLLYSAERNGSWNLYQSRMLSDDDVHFFSAGEIVEDALLTDAAETYQPAFSPNDSLIAYLHERVEIRIIEPATGRSWTVLPANKNYSYSDGDQYFEWSPDGKWIVSNFLPSSERWVEDATLVSVDGQTVINVTDSGYYEWRPQWAEDGSFIYVFSNELGMRSHGSWGSQTDVFAFYTSDSTFDQSKLTKAEIEEEKAREEKQKAKDEKDDDENDEEEKDDDETDEPEKLTPIRIETDGIRDRRTRLTVHSSNMSDARMTPDGEDLVYLARFEKGYDLWKVNLRERTPSLVAKLGSSGAGSIQFDSTGTHVFILTNGGGISKINLENGEQEGVGFSAEMVLNTPIEREYLFEHMWRQVQKKFYVEDLHHVKWDDMKIEYLRYLPFVNNNQDFSELMSELLGELNASHTGCYYRPNSGDKDHTYSLGMFLDDRNPAGLQIAEIINNGPADKFGLQITEGNFIEAIDGNSVTGNVNYLPLLNRLKDQKVRLSLFDPVSGERWIESMDPISLGQLNGLLYERWIETRRVLVDSLSHGTLGYVHVQGMGDGSFRKTFSEIFGRQVEKKALIVDTRFNGGGWLHDDLARLLSGTDYAWMLPRGQKVGKEPQDRWTKPVVVVMGEANYSDAHFFPYTFSALKIGKTVGMPVPGTATAVWWEGLQDPSLVFGIPQVGILDFDGNFLENQQLEPDYKVKNDPGSIAQGRDKQIEKAVQVLMEQVER